MEGRRESEREGGKVQCQGRLEDRRESEREGGKVEEKAEGKAGR